MSYVARLLKDLSKFVDVSRFDKVDPSGVMFDSKFTQTLCDTGDNNNSYDSLGTFSDATVERMLLALSECYVTRYDRYPLYDDDDHCNDDDNDDDDHHANVGRERRPLLTDRTSVFLRLRSDNIGNIVDDSDDMLFEVNNPTGYEPRFYRFVENDYSLSVFFLSRGHVRSLLYGDRTFAEYASLLYKLFEGSNKRAFPRPEDVVTIRASRAIDVARYELTYSRKTYRRLYDTIGNNDSNNDNDSSNNDDDNNNNDGNGASFIDLALKRMQASDDSYVPYNGFERVNALTNATIESSSSARNVNEVRLRRVSWVRGNNGGGVGGKKVKDDDDDDDNDERETNEYRYRLIATSVLLKADGLSSRGCVTVVKQGLYISHTVYPGFGYLLSPSHVTPVFDRSISVPRFDVDDGSNGGSSSSSSSNSRRNSSRRNKIDRLSLNRDNVYLRVCFLFDRNAERLYRLVDRPNGTIALLSDLLTYLFPRDDRDTGETASRKRYASIAKLVKFDPFASRVPFDASSVDFRAMSLSPPLSSSMSSSSSSLLSSLLSSSSLSSLSSSLSTLIASLHASVSLFAPMSVYRCDDAKLWLIMRHFRTRVAYVRSPVVYYSPMLCDLALSVRDCGLVPLSMLDANDTWKRYEYESRSCSSSTPLKMIRLTTSSSSSSSSSSFSSSSQFSSSLSSSSSSSLSSSLPLLVTKTRGDRGWLIYRPINGNQFDRLNEYARLYSSPTVALVDYWFASTCSLEKISSKRVYLFNGVLGFCESPCKFVSERREIVRYAGTTIGAISLADALLTDSEAKRVRLDVRSSASGIIDLPKSHFYNVVYRALSCDDNNGGKPCVELRTIDDHYYVITIVDRVSPVRLWFPRVRLYELARQNESICYANVPRRVAPLVDYYLTRMVSI